jgi:hypothetical protein
MVVGESCELERQQQHRATAASLSLPHHGAKGTSGAPVAAGRLIGYCRSTDVQEHVEQIVLQFGRGSIAARSPR